MVHTAEKYEIVSGTKDDIEKGIWDVITGQARLVEFYDGSRFLGSALRIGKEGYGATLTYRRFIDRFESCTICGIDYPDSLPKGATQEVKNWARYIYNS